MNKLAKFKSNENLSICSFNKAGQQIRLSNWVNVTSGIVTLAFNKIDNMDYVFGWKNYSDILIVKKRINGVAPVDVKMVLDNVIVEDLQDKADILHKSFIVEYSLQRIYQPITDGRARYMQKLLQLQTLITKNLKDISVSDMSKILRIVPKLKK